MLTLNERGQLCCAEQPGRAPEGKSEVLREASTRKSVSLCWVLCPGGSGFVLKEH